MKQESEHNQKSPEPELNEETLAYIRWQEENPDVWGDQDENGVDLARIRENLKFTPAERLDHHEAGRILGIIAKEAGEKYRASQRGGTRVS